MKPLINFTFLLVLGLSTPTEADNHLRIEWGLQNKNVYVEDRDGYYRFFGPKAEAVNENTVMECMARHYALWQEYLKQCKKDSKSPDKEEFQKLKEKKDGFCVGYFREMAPVFYFDFTANNSTDEYILDTIIIENIGNMFERKYDGGFVKEEAWYDLVLPIVGFRPKEYQVHRKLVFKGHGRIQLRLWSGVISSDEGWRSYRSGYSIKITFKFLVNGKVIEVRTGGFGMYV